MDARFDVDLPIARRTRLTIVDIAATLWRTIRS